ncbi:hypothetical protein AM277_11480 [Klebsiella pneumoniae]|nr:hypothetical protein AM275_18430 [Klebsiella pneumoniae]AOM98050.1 hypothetical protein AM277_11480 [Klebsiella pneumoniae]AON01264.1 hypothetical protein AM278_13590 [Klebsiella pneumoniae]
MIATLDSFIPEDAQASQTYPVNLVLMIVLYFSEFTSELLEGAKAFMLVPFTQVYNALCLGLPAYDPDRDTVVISEPSVELSHTSSAWPLKSPTTH